MRVLLLGHPLAHSLSPAIQNAAFAACHLPHRYEAVDVEAASLAVALADLRDDDCLGANVTAPYKRAVATSLDGVDADARVTGAVNTIVNAGGRLNGYNTDIEGAWRGLLEPVIDAISGGRVVLAGAGGGARAVLVAMARSPGQEPADVVVVARREGEAETVADVGRRLGLPSSARPWRQLSEVVRSAQVVVNCTPLGLYGEDPLEGIRLVDHVVLDLAYRPGGTPLVQRARGDGLRALQGDQMLVHQGAQSFRLWTGVEPPISAMEAAMKRELT
jgi:shikimate dehydrogenase